MEVTITSCFVSLPTDLVFWRHARSLTLYTTLNRLATSQLATRSYSHTNCDSHQHSILTRPGHKFLNPSKTYGHLRHFLVNLVTAVPCSLQRTCRYAVWVILLGYWELLSAVYSHLLIYCQSVSKYSDVYGLRVFHIVDISCIATRTALKTWVNVERYKVQWGPNVMGHQSQCKVIVTMFPSKLNGSMEVQKSKH
jgi:hypothetical protein